MIYTIFNISVNIDRRGSESHPHECLYNIFLTLTIYTSRYQKIRESSTTRQYFQPHERANSMLSFVQGRKLPRLESQPFRNSSLSLIIKSKIIYIASKDPRIEFLWPVQPFNEIVFIVSCSLRLQNFLYFPYVIVSNIYFLQL